MIRLTDRTGLEALENICRNDPVGIKILSNVYSYGFDTNFLNVWLQFDETDNVLAAVSSLNGSLTLLATEKAGLTELSEFLRVAGSEVLAKKPVSARLPFKETDWGYILEFDQPDQPVWNAENMYKIDSSPNLEDVYNIQVKADSKSLILPGFNSWYVDMNHRIRHGAAKAFAVNMQGRAVSTASLAAITDQSVVLGGVATLKECRGKGLSSFLCGEIIKTELLKGKRVYLFCRKELLGFYKGFGAKIHSEFCRLNTKEEQS